jgi:hypothetical protein
VKRDGKWEELRIEVRREVGGLFGVVGEWRGGGDG